MKLIENMRESDRISDIYLCKTKINAKTKAGKTYYSLTLQDKSGTIDGKIWDLSSGIDHFEAMDYIHVDGDVTTYQGSLQLNIRRVRIAREGEFNPADYLPSTPYDRKEMARRLTELVASVEDSENGPLEKRSTESHRKKIDFQLVVSGVEGFALLDHASSTVSQAYDEKKDVMRYNYVPEKTNFFNVKGGTFVIFFPSDWHIAKVQTKKKDQQIRVIVVKMDYVE